MNPLCGQILTLIRCLNRSLHRQKQILPITRGRGRGGYIMISRYFPSDLASMYPFGKQIKHMMYLGPRQRWLQLPKSLSMFLCAATDRSWEREGRWEGVGTICIVRSLVPPTLPASLSSFLAICMYGHFDKRLTRSLAAV